MNLPLNRCYSPEFTSIQPTPIDLDGNPTVPLKPEEFMEGVVRIRERSKQESWCIEYTAEQIHALAVQNPEVASSVGFPLTYLEIKRLGDQGAIEDNVLYNGEIKQAHFKNLEDGPLKEVKGIILHRTDTDTARAVLNGYKVRNLGAHYLIDTDGAIYQTASLTKQTSHVGKLRARCEEENTCNVAETEALKSIKSNKTMKQWLKPLHDHEKMKDYPDRYPLNSDSIGIEIVGKFNVTKQTYLPPTAEQFQSVQTLIQALQEKWDLTGNDVYPHGEVSRKQSSEGRYFGY